MELQWKELKTYKAWNGDPVDWIGPIPKQLSFHLHTWTRTCFHHPLYYMNCDLLHIVSSSSSRAAIQGWQMGLQKIKIAQNQK